MPKAHIMEYLTNKPSWLSRQTNKKFTAVALVVLVVALVVAIAVAIGVALAVVVAVAVAVVGAW